MKEHSYFCIKCAREETMNVPKELSPPVFMEKKGGCPDCGNRVYCYSPPATAYAEY